MITILMGLVLVFVLVLLFLGVTSLLDELTRDD